MSTTATTTVSVDEGRLERMFSAGAHYAYSKSRRHPTTKPYIFGAKERVELLDLEKTGQLLDEAKAFVQGLGAAGKTILFVAGKNEAQKVIREAADGAGLPYVSGRWIGGTLTNFPEIKKRAERLVTLRNQREKGELSKYTKKERLLIDREIDKLEEKFGGITGMDAVPHAMFVVDSKSEYIAVKEARAQGLPVIALTNSDCDLSVVDYPIVANDAARASITLFVNEIKDAYLEGTRNKKKESK